MKSNNGIVGPGSGYKQSYKLYREAKQLFPYGTQLFSRRPELGAYGQAPIYFEKMKDAHFWDVDGNEFIDTAMGIGPVILGYGYDKVDHAVKNQIDKGVLGSINNELEIEVAQAMVEMVPCAEMVKFCKSGGEADAIAVRMARAHTGREKVLFCGYHGWHDWYLAANLGSDSTLDTHLLPGLNPKGVPASLEGTCLPFEYNNLEQLESVLKENAGEVACIIMEPTRNKQPGAGFLEGVRQLADEHKCLLIFDEVITGFRMSNGGAQAYYDVTPDLATFAKAMANGYSLAAVTGRREIMEKQADNFISSTYWSDSTALAAGLATLTEIRNEPVIETLKRTGRLLMTHIEQLAQKHELKVDIPGHGSWFSLGFNYGEDTSKIMTLFIQEMIARGIYTISVFYMSYTHTSGDIERIRQAIDEVFELIKEGIQNDRVDKLLRCPVRQIGFKRLA
ncbi:MAG: aminotransferase class III-fold pyridoxal phosphate-dependent enzyme [Bacteroidota bacterium]